LTVGIKNRGYTEVNYNTEKYDLSHITTLANKEYNNRFYPSITSMTVKPGGSEITIKGNGFATDISALEINFGELPC
jgi:hypothetical protein